MLLFRSATARAAALEQAKTDLGVREQQLATREQELLARESALARALHRLEQHQEAHGGEQATLRAQKVSCNTMHCTPHWHKGSRIQQCCGGGHWLATFKG